MIKPICLIGFMGSGKSTIAKHLAEKKGVGFTDLDTYIQESEGISIPAIFETKGEAAFRQIESACLLETLKNPNQIIALGGGTPCFNDNMNIIRKMSTSVYLKVSPEGLQNRLAKSHNPRPLISGLSEDELLDYIKTNLEKREAFYLQADHIIQSDKIMADDLLQFIFI